MERRAQQEPEVGLSLAATGREPDNVGDVRLGGGVSNAREVCEEESNLERAPRRESLPGRRQHHGLVHEHERLAHDRVGSQEVEPFVDSAGFLGDLLGRLTGLREHLLGPPLLRCSGLQCIRRPRRRPPLVEGLSECLARAERLDGELREGDVGGHRPDCSSTSGGRRRQPGGPTCGIRWPVARRRS